MLGNKKIVHYSLINAATVFAAIYIYYTIAGRSDASGLTSLGVFTAFFISPFVFIVSFIVGRLLMALQQKINIPSNLIIFVIFLTTPLCWWLSSYWK